VSASDFWSSAACGFDCLVRLRIAWDCVRKMEGGTLLQAISINIDRVSPQRLDHEVCDPPLILTSILARSVDATLPKNDGAETVDARIISHVLVACSFGAAIGGVEIE